MDDKSFEERLVRLTEEDAGFRNERDYRRRRGSPELTLDDYRDILRFNRRDAQQMMDMGR
jgi:hypothetical protein